MTARRIVAALLIIVASVIAPFAVGALWAQRTITDAQQFAQTVAPLADDPVVQQAVEGAVSTAIIDAVDIRTRLEAVGFLPDIITESVASGVNSAIENGVEDYVQSERFGEVWLALASGVQAQFVALLEQDGAGAVQLQEGVLILDTAVVADLVKAELARRGVPWIGDVDAGLIDDQLVLAEAPNLQIVADALRTFLPAAEWLWVVVLAMLVAGVLLWRQRARGVMWAGLGLLLGGAITWVALDVGSAALADSAPDPNLRALMSATAEVLAQFLVNALLVMVALGVTLILGGWLAGATQSGRRVRDRIAETAHDWGAPLADSPIGRFTSEHPMFVPTLRALVLLGLAVFLVTADRLYPATILWTFVVVAGLLLLVEVVEGSGLLRERAHAGALVAQAPHPTPTGPGQPG